VDGGEEEDDEEEEVAKARMGRARVLNEECAVGRQWRVRDKVTAFVPA